MTSTTTTPVAVVSDDATKISMSVQEKPQLPKLSPAEFRRYNRMAEGMEYYHNHFRAEWEALYGAVSSPASGSSRLSAPAIIRTGMTFISHLTLHHDIEEAHIFPILGQRMSGFQEGEFAKQQHKEIHNGLDLLDEYLKACKYGERELRREELKKILDGFSEVLWTHLDQEVKELGAENMRKYWTLEEMKGMPM